MLKKQSLAFTVVLHPPITDNWWQRLDELMGENGFTRMLPGAPRDPKAEQYYRRYPADESPKTAKETEDEVTDLHRKARRGHPKTWDR